MRIHTAETIKPVKVPDNVWDNLYIGTNLFKFEEAVVSESRRGYLEVFSGNFFENFRIYLSDNAPFEVITDHFAIVSPLKTGGPI